MGGLLMKLPNDDAAELRKDYSEPPQTWTEIRESLDQADKAYEFMTQAKFAWNDGPDVVAFFMDCAKVHAQLALMDKVEEMTATLKEIVSRQCETMADLDATVQKATNAAVAELRRATMKEVA